MNVAASAPSFDLQVSLADPAGDGNGPDGAYLLLTDTTFGSQAVAAAGAANEAWHSNVIG